MLRNPGLRKSVEQPVLDLNFAASQIGSNGAPDSRIDFSRGNNAWFVDSDGLVKKSPHNLQVYSQDFDNADWGKVNSTVEANSIAAPDGTLTADKIVGTALENYHNVRDTIAVTSGTQYWISIYIKAGSTGTEFVFLETISDGSLRFTVFQFETESFLRIDSNHNHVSATDVGDGWYRFVCSITPDADRTSFLYYGMSDGTDPTFVATNQFIYFWGVQVSQHTTLPVGNPYVKTEGSAAYAARLDHDPTWFMSAAQEQNLFQYSEMVDDTYWTKTNASVTANAATDPLGGTTAEELAENTASGTHFVASDEQFFVTDGTQYTFSAYVKRGSGERDVRLWFTGANSAFAGSTAIFDLEAGTADNESCDAVSIEDIGDGWFRVSATETATATAQPDVRINLVNNASSYTGDGASSLFIWGIQLEVGSTASTYHRTEGAPYYGEGATPKGLLIEEQRANLVTDSESHTYFDTFVQNVTQTADAALAPDGTTTAVEMLETSDTGNHLMTKNVTVADNAAICFSYFVKANGRTTGAVEFYGAGGIFTTFNLATNSINVGTPYDSGTNAFGGIEDYGNGWFRVHTGLTTKSGDTSGTIQIRITDDGTTSYAGDTTKGLYVWGFQIEQGSFPTSYIQTTGNTKTRNADVAVMGPTTGGTELVTNGTFDTDTTGWTEGQTSGVTATVSSGVVTMSASTASGSGLFYQSGADTPTVIGRRYRATADVSVVSGTGVGIIVYSSFFSGAYGSNTISSGTNQTVTVDFTATTTAAHVAIFRVGTFAANDVYRVDNVSVRELYPFEQYNPAEGTMYSESESTAEVLNSCVFVLTDRPTSGSATDRLEIRHYGSTANSSRMEVVDGGVAQASISPTQTSDFRRNALAYGTNSVNAAGDGVSGTEDTSVSVPSVDEVLIGSNTFNIDYTGYIKRLSYYPRRLSDEAIENLTSD